MQCITELLNKISFFHLNILLLLGIALFGGTIGGRVFQKFRIPQVVGYIVIGILLGQSGLGIVDKKIIDSLVPVNYFALGLIAFMVGGELKKETLLKYGKQFVAILLAEGLGAFLIVGISTALIYWLFSHNLRLSISIGILLGAIASATDAASTINVLWEYKAKGVLTTTTLGIVALDDGLSFLLFSLASSIVGIIIGIHSEDIFHSLLHSIWEIIGSLLIGIFSGAVLRYFLDKYTEEDKRLTFLLGGVMITLGLSLSLGMDMLLAAMSLGVMLVNSMPRRSKEVFALVEKIAPPIYVLFFVLVGATLKMSLFTTVVGALVVVYILGRTFGKFVGSYFGAVISNGSEKVKKYLWLCLFSQASAAIGLSILCAQLFPGEIGSTVVAVVTITTFVVQMIGPLFVKMAIERVGEAGRNVSEEDLRERIKVKDVMDEGIPVLTDQMQFSDMVKIFRDTDYLLYPVVDRDGRLKGIISMEDIKNVLALTELAEVVVADDLCQPCYTAVRRGDKLSDIFDKLISSEFLPVVDEEGRVVGIIDSRRVKRELSSRLVALNEQIYE